MMYARIFRIFTLTGIAPSPNLARVRGGAADREAPVPMATIGGLLYGPCCSHLGPRVLEYLSSYYETFDQEHANSPLFCCVL